MNPPHRSRLWIDAWRQRRGPDRLARLRTGAARFFAALSIAIAALLVAPSPAAAADHAQAPPDDATAARRSAATTDHRAAAPNEEWLVSVPPLAIGLTILAAVGCTAFLAHRRRERSAAAMLRYSEERWKFALEGSGDGMWDADLVTGTTRHSRRWKAMLGHADHEIGDDPGEWRKRIHPKDSDRVLADNQACLDGVNDAMASEYRMRTKDGRWIWVLDRGKVMQRDASGKPLRMIGTLTDISASKSSQFRLAAQADAMTLVATGAPLAQILRTIVVGVESMCDWRCSILLLDADGRHLLTGAAPSLPTFYSDAVHGLAIGPGVGACGSAAHGGQRVVSHDIRTDPRWADFRELADRAGLRACWSQPIISASGAVLGTFAAYHDQPRSPAPADIDNIVEATRMTSIAIERSRGEQALRTSEERLKRALDASRLALWDFDLDSGTVYLSDAWSEMLGGPRQTTTTTFDALGKLVPDEDQLRIAQAMADALRGTTPAYSIEHRVRRPDGQWLWILSQARVVERSPDGQARRAVGTNRDITERKRADATQAELEAQLREAQKLQAIGTLAGGIAHDFNNILAAILGHVALACEDVADAHPAQRHLTQIQKAGLRARNLVKQILAFSRVRANTFVSLSLRPVVDETVQMLRATAGAAARLELSLAEAPLRVMGDATQLQQVLMNLGSNACQALTDGAGRVEIGLCEVEFSDDPAARPAGLGAGRHARLWVADDGCGIDARTRQRIFEPFFTTKPVGQGTGLGLAVVHGIVEAHRGAIVVRSAVGQGSRFDVYLPLVDTESTFCPLEVPRCSPPCAAEPSAGRGQHVLYVDDDEVMAMLVEGLLLRLGYRATCMLDAEAAIALVQADPSGVDLVVTDFNMPRCTGLELARAMGRLRPDLPVAISSGYVCDQLRADAAAIGVRGVMQKENTFEELAALAHAALQPEVPADAW